MELSCTSQEYTSGSDYTEGFVVFFFVLFFYRRVLHTAALSFRPL